jgi:glycosyltransferase involved in cell wall biosynthesis
MNDESRARDHASLPDETRESFRRTAFVLGPFPVVSQTFIYRELDSMRDLGLDVQVISTGPRKPEDKRFTRMLTEVQRSALYLDYRSVYELASVATRLASPRVLSTMRWMMRFPHRTPAKRSRAAAAVLVAAHFAPALAERGVRYVHSQFAGFQTEIAMSLAKLLGISYGCTWHAYGIYKDRNILKEKIAGAQTVMTCTRYNETHLRTLCPDAGARIQLAYHGLDLDRLPEPSALSDSSAPIILAVGRFVAKKGFAHLLDAAATLKREGRRFEVRFIGDGPGRAALEAQVDRLAIRNEVSFLGVRPNAEVFAEIDAARVVAVPSVVTDEGDMDGLPNVVLEALGMGRPVVGSRMSAIPEVLVDGETGYLVEPGDESDLAAKLSLVLDDPSLAARLGRQGRMRILRDFDVKKNVRTVVDTIARAAQARAR